MEYIMLFEARFPEEKMPPNKDSESLKDWLYIAYIWFMRCNIKTNVLSDLIIRQAYSKTIFNYVAGVIYVTASFDTGEFPPLEKHLLDKWMCDDVLDMKLIIKECEDV